MEAKLFDAACSGNLDALYDVVRESGAAVLLKLHLSGSVETPLHLASMFGQAEFVREYMRLCSISAHQLSQLNQDGCSPLHLASAGGHLEIVQYLLEFGKQKSFVEDLCMKTDIDGRTALHCAVVTGKIDVIDVLFVHCPQASKEVTLQQETVLHLAVKHHQHKALEFLIDQKLGLSVEDLLNVGDREGNTILHLATAKRQLQTVEYLVKQRSLNVNVENSYGLRALDIMFAYAFNPKDVYIEEAIRRVGGCRSQTATSTTQTRPSHDTRGTSLGSSGQSEEWLKELRSGIIVMASVFATLTFQVALTPPGGLWQDWGSNEMTSNSSVAVPAQLPGVPILYDLNPNQFTSVMTLNKLSFMTSIATIILMIQPFKIQSGKFILMVLYLNVLTVIIMSVEFLQIGSLLTLESPRSQSVWVAYPSWLLIIAFAIISFIYRSLEILTGKKLIQPQHIFPRVWKILSCSSRRATSNTQSSSNSSSENARP